MITRVVPAGLTDFRGQVTTRIAGLADGLPGALRAPVCDLASSQGKLLRPMLVRASAQSGTPDPGRLVRLGAVVELLHLASLLHDDIIDQAATRRGHPAAHLSAGRETAVLAGLACFALAGTEAADLGRGVDLLVGQTAARLAYGELLDVERAFDTAIPLPGYLELVECKTADLFRLCCLLGASEAGAEPEAARLMGAFGRDVGVAFQILDDCRDLDRCQPGKPTGTDHLLGLFSAPTLYALADDDTGELAALLLSPGFGLADMHAVRELVSKKDGLAAAARLAGQCYQRALSSLGRLPDAAARAALAAVAGLAWRDMA